ncbi:BZ3500_MvSof-1268-A1-R1_Chr1-3g02497 [Microbotryum saponariae]|uniref:BZ3500_MvSof-1268-A1-R1_Chr1-3g02497 protein n=1 Tax=Microbotryum saponariae TaxID=289078 RepID=A0A2X0KRC4_9BASI|nr:BZ3500_MvSof-1268-A1-R1_Chr1-3g02497 [Microbotryum saponariae]SCZ96402.1 BZ3501_MvSof-1269-A2-R1_Chr1-3g02100 [Microbotryum saponariae]
MSSTSTTPRTLSAGSSIPFSALTQYVNHPIRVLLVPNPTTSSTPPPSTPANSLPSQTAKGTLYTVDHHTQCLVLTTPSTSSTSTTNKSSSSSSTTTTTTTTTRNYSFHPFASIQSTTLLSTLPDPSLPPLSTSTSKTTPDLRMDQEEMKLRIEKGVAALVKERSRKPPQGVGVTPETQALFDGLAKTMPVRWHGAQIIVMDQVIISPPYTVDQVKGEKGAHEGVERVKKVLQGERQRRTNKPTTS